VQPYIQEVLVWRGNRIGDVVITFPALKIIRSCSPKVRITYVTTDYARELVELSCLADTVFVLKFEGGIRNFWRYRALRKLVKQGRFDRIFIFGKTDRYSRHIGPVEEVFRSEEFPFGHKAERLARAVIKGLGLEECNIPWPRIDLPDETSISDKLASLGLEMTSQPYLVIHPGCHAVARRPQHNKGNEPLKSWPPHKYVELISGLRTRLPWLTVALVGTSSERPLVEGQIETQLPSGSVINLCGRTRLRELLQLLKHAAAFVGGDSGVTHLGSLTGTPMVVLFGPTNEAHTGPYGMGERAVFLRAMPCEEARQHPDCMEKISVERVSLEIEKLLDPVKGR
jgi:ADP-heptose:LPS heptosyltransferase